MSIATTLGALQTAKANIAGAITAKGGTVNAGDGFADFTADIATIPAGGGVTESDVNFYDYDGTLVAGYTIAAAQALEALPAAPEHDGLTFQEWNYTLAQVNATASKLNAGATYITTDGKTHFHITLTAVTGVAPTLYLNKSDGSTLTVDWGDSTADTFTNSGNFNTGAHTYPTAGDYIIKMWISSGGGTYGFGNGSSSTVVVGGSTAVYIKALIKAFTGTGVISIGTYAFLNCYSLTSVVIPNSVTSIGDRIWDGCYSLTSVVIPNGITSIGINVFNSCYSLKSIAIPIGVKSIGTAAFGNCYTLTSVIIPSGITSVGASAFTGCFSCKYYNVQASTPPTLANVNAFANIVPICIIHVPAASLSTYQAATNWSAYANYMVGDL